MKKAVVLSCLIFLLGRLEILAQAQANNGYPTELTVASDGSGNCKTLQEAIDKVRAYSPIPLKIFIKKGVYHEKVIIPSWVTNITITGESRDSTIITYEDYSGKPLPGATDTANKKNRFTTFNSYTVWVQGNDVHFKNLTIKNAAGRVGQAVALHVDGDRFEMEGCNLLGNQDTLLTANDSSRQYYVDCYIEGTTDFIFGPATAVFQGCTIKSLINSFVTAASTSQNQKFGYVFFNCKLIADTSVHKEFLGRPWRQYAKVVYLNCELGNHILPVGWQNWGNVENEKTAYYAEYNNKGEGAATNKRVPWSKQLTKDEAKQYTLENIFNGWKPI